MRLKFGGGAGVGVGGLQPPRLSSLYYAPISDHYARCDVASAQKTLITSDHLDKSAEVIDSRVQTDCTARLRQSRKVRGHKKKKMFRP